MKAKCRSDAYQGAHLKRAPNSVLYRTVPNHDKYFGIQKLPRQFYISAVVFPILPTELLFLLLFLPLSTLSIKGNQWGAAAKAMGSPRDALFAWIYTDGDMRALKEQLLLLSLKSKKKKRAKTLGARRDRH